jgi:hypothetical protein
MSNKWAISPSELSAATCHRRHVFKYVLKLDRDDENQNRESAAFGDRVHDVLERWVRTGQPIDQDTQEGKVAASMLPWAPHPRAGTPEGKIRFVINGVTYGGRYDWSGIDRDLAGMVSTAEIPVILDYKTSTSPEQYGLWTKEDFLNDDAAILYAADRLAKTPSPHILFRWLYGKVRKGKVKAEGDVRTKEQGAEMVTRFYPAKMSDDEFMARGIKPMGKEGCARASDMLLTYSEVETAYITRVEPKARHVLNVLRNESNPLRLDANLSECSAYGGCPHQHRCAPTLTDRQKVEAGFRREYIDTMGLAGSLLKGLQAQAQPAVQDTATVTAPPVGQTVAPAFGGFKGFNPPEVSAPATVVHSLGTPSGFVLGQAPPAAISVATTAPVVTPVLASVAAVAACQPPAETHDVITTAVASDGERVVTKLTVPGPAPIDPTMASDTDLGRAVRTLMEAWARTASAQGLK